MRALLPAILLSVAPLASALLAPLLLGCDDTPRGEQGIDFLADGGAYSVPSGPEASADVEVPCVEDGDAGVCAQAASSGTPATHVIVCKPGDSPADILCVTPPGAAADAGTFCCTTGVL